MVMKSGEITKRTLAIALGIEEIVAETMAENKTTRHIKEKAGRVGGVNGTIRPIRSTRREKRGRQWFKANDLSR